MVSTIKISCTVLEEEGKIKEEGIKDALNHGVQLKGAKRPRGSNKKPQLQWLDENVGNILSRFGATRNTTTSSLDMHHIWQMDASI